MPIECKVQMNLTLVDTDCMGQEELCKEDYTSI